MASSSNTINADKQRKRRKNLSFEDKIDIVKRKDADVKLSDERLAIEFGVERSTISGILRKREKFTTENDIRYMRNIIQRLDESVERSKCQTSLIEYINQ